MGRGGSGGGEGQEEGTGWGRKSRGSIMQTGVQHSCVQYSKMILSVFSIILGILYKEQIIPFQFLNGKCMVFQDSLILLVFKEKFK